MNPHFIRRAGTPLAIAALCAIITPEPALASEIQRPVQTMVQAVRYERVDLALGQLAGEQQGSLLLGDAWNEASAEDKAEFIGLFHRLFAAIAFPKVKENFEHLETILYEDPSIEGDRASLTSTVVVLHAMVKREIRVKYELVRVNDAWRVLDAQLLGTGGGSMIEEIRTEQIQPIMEEGGLSLLLELMRQRLAALEAQAR